MPFRLLINCFMLLCFCIPSFAQNHYDVVIDELFPDPTPVIGLPNAEFIELKNVSDTAFNLHNWKISDGTSTAIIKSNFILQPDSFVVICASSSVAAYSNFGATIGVANFPSLNNDGDIIYLQSPAGLIIHVVAYDKSWYQNDIKSNGGWTLEMIDTKNPCTGFENWKASTNVNGGTPGQKNSADGINKDEQPPVLLRTYTIDSLTIVAVFNEPLDSNSAANISNYFFDNNINNPIAAIPQSPLFTQVILKLSVKISPNIIYHLTSNNVSDCVGNISVSNIVKAGLPVLPDTNNIVINEILFNPKTNGYDYAEFYNRSNKVIDIQQLYVATRDATGLVKSISQLSATPLLFFPGDYYVITENTLWVEQNYLVKNPDKMIQLSSLPSFPDDDGIIVLLNLNEKVIDELHYNSSWQLAVITDAPGVALERINYNKPAQNAENWASAASTAGYGTPTYQNSEFQSNQFAKGEINISPKIFSPDNDGYEDYCFINYTVPNPGYVANINIYDASGRVVRNLAGNATLALTGTFKWDGLDDKQQKLPVGIYIISTQIFDLTGKTKQFKNVVTLARRL
jgi:lamin tail-like protein/flagellar hook capping protein FlgD